MTTAAVAGWFSNYEVGPTTGGLGMIPFGTVFLALVLLGKTLNENQCHVCCSVAKQCKWLDYF